MLTKKSIAMIREASGYGIRLDVATLYRVTGDEVITTLRVMWSEGSPPAPHGLVDSTKDQMEVEQLTQNLLFACLQNIRLRRHARGEACLGPVPEYEQALDGTIQAVPGAKEANERGGFR